MYLSRFSDRWCTDTLNLRSSKALKHWDAWFPLKFNTVGQTEGFYKSVSYVALLRPSRKSLAEGGTYLMCPRSQDIIVTTEPSFPLWSWSFYLVFSVDTTKYLNNLCIIQRIVYSKHPTSCSVFKCSCIFGVLAACEVRAFLIPFNTGSCFFQPSSPHTATEVRVSKNSLPHTETGQSGRMYCWHTRMAGKWTNKQFVQFKNSLLPSEEPQTVCPHGLVTELGCHTHSVRAQQGFLCLKKEK